jgi:hypothetical protein
MIKFFRKIRQNVLMENKTGKYFKYAIGEIILVVIGILIALQINNWNEQRKLDTEEQYLLNELMQEFQINLKDVKKDDIINGSSKDAAFGIMHMIQEKSIQNNTSKLDSLFFVVVGYSSYNASTGVLDEIISSGKLRAIKDIKLKTLLTQWSGIIENQQEDITVRREYINTFVIPHYSKNAPMKNVSRFLDFSHWSKRYKGNLIKKSNFNYDIENIESREFESFLYKYTIDQDFILLNNSETKDYIKSVINLINLNLNN